ncbi:restriction endonuclease subunit S [Microscilla marina]|uniref:Type I restriction enzyme StySJI specificity protein n=1 Tax=Microscilla marina ATCC 23134 TaxID=313606 RepID=A1ZTI8_MICM2|nr:restriction endonuclease subunit S [Microscilla marina]EAY26248.1 type I restriction enzyme StySJI specificity protein [Microscilla marina ATCC 23134]
MSNWEEKKIQDFAEVKGGKRLPAGKEFSLTPTKHPYLRVTDMVNGSIDTSNLQYVDEEIEKVIRNYRISADDLYITIAGTIGSVGNIPELLHNALLTENAAKITNIDKSIIDKNYLQYYLSSEETKSQINKEIGIGGGVPKLALYRILNLVVQYPPLTYQRKIAQILSTVDRVIDGTQRAIEKYQTLKEGLMQDLFSRGIDVSTGKLRPPRQVAPELYQKTELGWIPKDYSFVRLEDLTLKIIDGTHHTPKYTESGIPFLRVTDVQTKDINFDKLKFVSLEEHQILTKRCNPEKGDLLLSKNGTIGIPKVVDWDWEFSIFVSLALIKPNHRLINVEYLLYFLKSELIKNQIIRQAKQGTVTNLHLEEIREFKIAQPPSIQEQNNIVEKLNNLEKQIESEQKSFQKLKTLKQALMQDLLTGKVSVEAAEAMVSPKGA